MKWFNDPVNRGWVYRILVAVGALVAGYGFMSGEQIAQWLGLAAVVLNIMPTANTSVKRTESFDTVANTES
jgi:hypothetical protein